MSKLKLQVDIDYDFFLFGIVCAEKPYRLCWALNQQLKTAFKKSDDRELAEKNKTDSVKFPVFSFRNEEMFTDYRIIVNKSDIRFFVPEYKHSDYLLMVQGGIPFSEKENMLKKIREINFIQTAFEINPKTLRSKENFLF